jgi:NADH:ubiquinone oxidoreductase subunit 2 (subunit N)
VLSIGKGYLFISFFALIMAIIGIYYYFNVIRDAYSESEVARPVVISRMNAALILICTFGVIFLGLFYRSFLI